MIRGRQVEQIDSVAREQIAVIASLGAHIHHPVDSELSQTFDLDGAKRPTDREAGSDPAEVEAMLHEEE